MYGALVQAKIWRGYAQAATKLGSEYLFYRPQGANLQLENGGNLELEDGGNLLQEGGQTYPGTPLFSRFVSLNAEDMKYGRPQKYGKSTWYALMDGTSLQVGDYFIGQAPGGSLLLENGGNLMLENGSEMLLEGNPLGTFFIAAMQLLLPILVIQCNRTISISRPQAQSGMGAQSYSGMTSANEIPIVTGVPCSILQGTKGEKNETALPGDTRSPWWTILLPASVGRIMLGDLLIDDLGQRYVVSSPELTALGWRLTAMMAMA
jgi:hypothetical protein